MSGQADNVVAFVRLRPLVPPCPSPEEAKGAAVLRLRDMIGRGSIVYAVLRFRSEDNTWMVCDFFLIDGHDVTCITRDVALVTDCLDPKREIGVKLRRGPGADPLTRVIEGSLSLQLFGEVGVVSHQLIAR